PTQFGSCEGWWLSPLESVSEDPNDSSPPAPRSLGIKGVEFCATLHGYPRAYHYVSGQGLVSLLSIDDVTTSLGSNPHFPKPITLGVLLPRYGTNNNPAKMVYIKSSKAVEKLSIELVPYHRYTSFT
ncbi:hypothetical protein ACJX0J_036769, partial [Zea mays]